MTFATALLHAERVGVRSFRESASRFIRKRKTLVITEHGTPESVLLPYSDILEIVDILDELQDKKLTKSIAEGKRAIRAGVKGIPFSATIRKFRA